MRKSKNTTQKEFRVRIFLSYLKKKAECFGKRRKIIESAFLKKYFYRITKKNDYGNTLCDRVLLKD